MADVCLASNRLRIAVAQSRPSRIAQTTSEAPRTMSPTQHTRPRDQWPRSSKLVPVNRKGAPCRETLTARVRRRAPGRSSGSKPSALITMIGVGDGESRCRRSARPTGGRRRPAGRDACGSHHHAGHAGIAEEGFLRRGQPLELHAFLLGVLPPHAASRACWCGRGDTGRSPRLAALAHRGADAIHRRVAAADHHHASCRLASSLPLAKSATVSPKLPHAVRCSEVVESPRQCPLAARLPGPFRSRGR